MDIRLGDDTPDFTAETTHGSISFHEWMEGGWGVLLSHPKDFTLFCTDDAGIIGRMKGEFVKRNVKVLGVRLEPDELKGSPTGIEGGRAPTPTFPMIADPERRLSHLYGMIHPIEGDAAPVRSVFLVGPDRKLKLIHVYPQSKGRDFDEILRVIDSLQEADEGSRRSSRREGFSMSVPRKRAVTNAEAFP